MNSQQSSLLKIIQIAIWAIIAALFVSVVFSLIAIPLNLATGPIRIYSDIEHVFYAVFFSGYTFLAWQLLQIIRALGSTKVFDTALGKRLRIFGVVLIVLSLLATFVEKISILVQWQDTRTINSLVNNAGGLALTFARSLPDFLGFNLSTLLLGLAVISLGEVIVRGRKLAREAELTI